MELYYVRCTTLPSLAPHALAHFCLLPPGTHFFFNFKKNVSGDQIDALLAGPKRPLEGDAQTTTAAVNGQWQAQMQTRASAIAAQASQAGNEIYSNLAAALNERG